MELNEALFEKLIVAQSPDELMSIGLENDFEISTDTAVRLFGLYQAKPFTLDELESIEANSICRNGRHYSSEEPHDLIVLITNECPDVKQSEEIKGGIEGGINCQYCQYHYRKKGIEYCNHRTLGNDPFNK